MTPPTIIAVSGHTGSGKTTFARALAEHLRWPRVAYSDILREHARRHDLPTDRAALQHLGRLLSTHGWDDLTTAVLTRRAPGVGLIVEGLRHLDALACLRAHAAPAPLLHVHLSTDPALARERALARDRADPVALHAAENQIPALDAVADLALDPGDTDRAVRRVLTALDRTAATGSARSCAP